MTVPSQTCIDLIPFLQPTEQSKLIQQRQGGRNSSTPTLVMSRQHTQATSSCKSTTRGARSGPQISPSPTPQRTETGGGQLAAPPQAGWRGVQTSGYMWCQASRHPKAGGATTENKTYLLNLLNKDWHFLMTRAERDSSSWALEKVNPSSMCPSRSMIAWEKQESWVM